MTYLKGGKAARFAPLQEWPLQEWPLRGGHVMRAMMTAMARSAEPKKTHTWSFGSALAPRARIGVQVALLLDWSKVDWQLTSADEPGVDSASQL